jgi:hypothetical protein
MPLRAAEAPGVGAASHGAADAGGLDLRRARSANCAAQRLTGSE